MIVDDYGHHPTEVSSTIKAVNKLKGDKELFVVFEPHRYTRTFNCWNEFLQSFSSADSVYILPIYPAGEESIEGITSERLVDDLNNVMK